MAHTNCFNNHYMWNGDGKPCVAAYRINYFRDLQRREPDCVIHHDFSGKYPYIYDCVENVPGEDLDIWYCDKCGAVAIFVDWDKERYDYVPCGTDSIEANLDYLDWEEYIAFRDTSDDSDDFIDFSDGKRPLDALLTYGFKERFFLSPDKQFIVKSKEGQGIVAVYKLASYNDFRKNTI